MLSLFKVSFCLPSILLVCNIVFGQGSEVDESNNFVGIGAGLNPLCIAVSEDRFACTTQASFFAKVQRFNLFTKIDESYVYLSSRKSESKDSNMKADEWGPRMMFLTSFSIGYYKSFFSFSQMPLQLGFGVGRFRGRNSVVHLKRPLEASAESNSQTELLTDQFKIQGTIIHMHADLVSNANAFLGGTLKILLNIEGFLPDHVGDDAFSTGNIVTMPTPQLYLGWIF